MSDFQRFLKKMPQVPIDERIHIFRHEALRTVQMSKGYAALLKAEGEKCPELSAEAGQWLRKLLNHLDEMQQLLDVLVEQPHNKDSK